MPSVTLDDAIRADDLHRMALSFDVLLVAAWLSGGEQQRIQIRGAFPDHAEAGRLILDGYVS